MPVKVRRLRQPSLPGPWQATRALRKPANQRKGVPHPNCTLASNAPFGSKWRGVGVSAVLSILDRRCQQWGLGACYVPWPWLCCPREGLGRVSVGVSCAQPGPDFSLCSLCPLSLCEGKGPIDGWDQELETPRLLSLVLRRREPASQKGKLGCSQSCVFEPDADHVTTSIT